MLDCTNDSLLVIVAYLHFINFIILLQFYFQTTFMHVVYFIIILNIEENRLALG